DPATIRLNIEPSARRSVKVDPEITGSLSDDLAVAEIHINPPYVEIEGPKSQVAKIDSVRTESIDLDGHTTDFSATVSVDNANPSVRISNPAPIRVSLKITKKALLHETTPKT